RRGLGRPGAAELPLGGEGDAAHAGASVARRLADEDEPRLRARLQVLAETPAPELGAGVLVERRADPRLREPRHEVAGESRRSRAHGVATIPAWCCDSSDGDATPRQVATPRHATSWSSTTPGTRATGSRSCSGGCAAASRS